MFLENGLLPTNKFWMYIVGSLLIILASTIGQIPWLTAVAIKSFKTGKKFPTNESDLMSFLSSNVTLFLLMISFVFAFVAIVLVVKYFHKQTFLSVTTSRKKVDWKRILFSFSLWSIFTVATTLLMYYTSPENFVLNFKPIPFLILAIIGIVLIPIQTSTEEYVFRGYLMQGFAVGLSERKFIIGVVYTFIIILVYKLLELIIDNQLTSTFNSFRKVMLFFLSVLIVVIIDFILTKLNCFKSNFYLNIYQNSKRKYVPLVLTSVIFGSMHIANPEVEKMGYIVLVYYIGTGLFLGIITLMDEGMELALGFHAANNLVTALLVTSDWSAFQTNSILKDVSSPSAGVEIVTPIFIIFPILLFIFRKKYNWTNWKEKLTGEIIVVQQIEKIKNDGSNE